MSSSGRIRALLGKDLADLRKNPSVFGAAVFTGLMAILLPFFVAVIIPALTGERLAESNEVETALELYRDSPELVGLSAEAAAQALIFQQFVIMLVMTPVAASMSVAAYSVIGEKQARTLEPLLATPITTFELLSAKVLASVIPALALTFASFGLYVGGAALFAQPGVAAALLEPRSLMIVFLVGPLAALAALQLAVCVSSRVNDPRSAQQIGALIILPIAGLLIAQVMGSLLLTGTIILLMAVGLAIVNAALMALGIALFDRESILTRWK